jgi:hypothetical protein
MTDEDIAEAAANDPDAVPTDADIWKDAWIVMPNSEAEGRTQ